MIGAFTLFLDFGFIWEAQWTKNRRNTIKIFKIV